MKRTSILGVVLAMVLAGPALADSHGMTDSESHSGQSESRLVYGTNMIEAGPYVELDTPTEPWKYQTFYFFALTRGLVEEDLTRTEKGLVMVGTIPLDLVALVGAALAGLFG